MRDACLAAWNRYRKVKPYEKSSTFLCRVKKGSRHLRNILTEKNNDFVPHNLVKFAESTEIVINSDVSKLIMDCGGSPFLTMPQERLFSNYTTIPLVPMHECPISQGINPGSARFAILLAIRMTKTRVLYISSSSVVVPNQLF
jgi:hypothetical protein